MASLVLNDRLFQCAEDNAFDLIRAGKIAVLMSMRLLLWQTFFAMTHVLALLVALIHTVTLALAEDQSRRNKSEESCE
jgi:hypothetical protein